MGGSPFGPFVNKNHFAGWMLMALPLTIGLLVRRHLARHARRQADLAGAASCGCRRPRRAG